MLNSNKTNQALIDLFDVSDTTNTDETIFWQNSEVLLSTINEKIKMIEIIMKIHLVHNLKVKLFIDIDILDSEEMNISFCNCFLIINSKDRWETKIHVHAKNNICIY